MDKKLYDLMDWAEIEAIVYSEHDHPENVLGPHRQHGSVLLQAFFPGAKSVAVKAKEGKMYQMEEADEEGFFAVLLPQRKVWPYLFAVEGQDGQEHLCHDPYQYPPFLKEKDLALFGKGKHYGIYRYLGAHPAGVSGYGEDAVLFWEQEAQEKREGQLVKGTHFAVWAPNAMRVSVVGDFNQWDGRRHPMYRLGDSGVFSLFIPDVGCGELYKYEVKTKARAIRLKSDPYGFYQEVRPNNASIVANLFQYTWGDAGWIAKRTGYQAGQEPMAVYEMHLGSWEKPEGGGFPNYHQIAPKIARYVKEMGYTHVELMPVAEHPQDGSWGYQVTGYYAATSRYGTPNDFQYFVDCLHQAGIGVILDWVPAYFPKDENGLARFDGTCLYEHFDPRQGEHPRWGTLLYNYGRPQVANFLIANALFWKEVYHIDGIRVGAVSSMLYLDYEKRQGEWLPNEFGGNRNLQAVEMLQTLSRVFHKKKDGALLIAEESSDWPMVTGGIEEGGLGFDFKWNTEWTNHFISYMMMDPYFRKGSHGMLISSMLYAYSEHFILPFSHYEATCWGCSVLGKMPGDIEQKFGNMRAAYGFMMLHPGKKLLFMGQEFGQEEPWNEGEGLHWEALQKPPHKKLQAYVRELNHFYLEHPALSESDYEEDGFEWISCLDADHSIIVFMRRDSQKKEQLMAVCNFTPVLYENFKIGAPFEGTYQEIFNSDSEAFGGTGCLNRQTLYSKEVGWDGRPYSVTIDVPPFGICIFDAVPEGIS